jgi:hypothetical protein
MFMLRSVSAPLAPVPAIELSHGVGRIIEAMCRAIAAQAARNPARAALLVLLWSRLRRLARRIAFVAHRAAAGTLRARPGRSVSPPDPAPAPHPRAAAALPRSLRALARLAPDAACLGGQLSALLSRPEVAALLRATPRLARHIRPLCRLLGVDPAPPAPPPPSGLPAPSARAAPARCGAAPAARRGTSGPTSPKPA